MPTSNRWLTRRGERAFRLLGLASLICFASVASAQQPAAPPPGASDPQAVALIRRSLGALTGGAPIADVTLAGTITVKIGSASQSGTAVMVATASGQSKVTYTFPSGARTEIRSASAGSQSLIEIGEDGLSHGVHTQSVLSPHPAWFFPALVLQSGMSSPDYAASYVGPEARSGGSVQHIGVNLVRSGLQMDASDLQRMSQHDIYLDSASLLPVTMTSIVHPYVPDAPDAPIVSYRGSVVDRVEEVTFSDYRQVQGRPVAFHIQTTLKTNQFSVVSDIQISSVDFNTGVTVATN